MANELMYKAHTYDPSKHMITKEWFVSEKLDGRYFLWDGGITRGMDVKEVPWANTQKDRKTIYSTGMWSSRGKVIHIPNTDDLPNYMLDGELYCGRGKFQDVISITRRDVPDSRWDDVEFKVFGSPDPDQFMKQRLIEFEKDNFKIITKSIVAKWAPLFNRIPHKDWDKQYEWLQTNYKVVLNRQLDGDGSIASKIKRITDGILELGGEGIMLRAPWARWVPGRQHTILKHKPYRDAEAVVTGFTYGEGRLEGLMGALTLDNGLTLGGGFTDEERILIDGKPMYFNIGETITFKYREMTDGGIPKEARYWRKR